jgi:hypothetical protein
VDENNFGFSYLDQGLITTNWVNTQNEKLEKETPLFWLKFKAKENRELSNLIKLNSKLTTAEAYNPELQIVDIELAFDDISVTKNVVTESAVLYQNYPNPFRENTKIGFEIPVEGNCVLAIFDLKGQQITSRAFDATIGYNEVVVHRKEIKKSGLYYYRLITPSGSSLVKKLIVK